MNPFRQNNPFASPRIIDALLILSIIVMTFCYKLIKADPQGLHQFIFG